jgi:hypothetical protein
MGNESNATHNAAITTMLSPKAKDQRGLAVDIISSIDNDEMHDMILLSIDGGEIPASRFVLGARSPVLRQMLFLNRTNRVTTSSELKITYSATVARALVYYCRTNELDDISLPTNEESLRELVKLSQCAIELELVGLEALVGNLVASLCQVDPHVACTFFDEAASGGGKPPVDSIKSIAFDFIRRNPETALLRKNHPRGQHFFGGIASLRAESLKEILNDPAICTEEINLFRAIVIWAEAPCKQQQGPKIMDAWAAQIMNHNQREAAKAVVAECIDLSKIAPSDLLGIVTESGLVDEIDVSNALIQIVLRIEAEGVHLSKRRSDDLRVVPRPASPSPRSQVSYCSFEQNSGVDSVTDIFGDLTIDHQTASSFTYVPVEQSNKRKPNKQQPKIISPPRNPAPSFHIPERQPPIFPPLNENDVAPIAKTRERQGPMMPPPPPPPPPPSPFDDVASVAKTVASSNPPPPPPAMRKKTRGAKTSVHEKNTIGTRIRKAVGMYQRDKVDKICIHPNNGDDDDEPEIIGPRQPPQD